MENKDIFETEWEQNMPPENEMKQIHRSIRKRNWKIIAISVILAAALMLVSVLGIIPALEDLYWHPYDGTVGEGVTDLTLVLSAYTELFQPGWVIDRVYWGKNGFAAYDLDIVRQYTATNEYKFMTGHLDKGQLHWDYHFSSEQAENFFYDSAYLYPNLFSWEDSEKNAADLAALPEYVTVEARIFFSQNLDMDQILKLREEYQLPITWIGIQNAPENFDVRLCGMSPFSAHTIYYEVNKKYPQFCVETSKNPDFAITSQNLEDHFKSLLRFSSDMLEEGHGARVYGGDRNYYREVLEYVEENGIMSYGMIVAASPQVILELMNNEWIADVAILDGWLDIG